MQYGVQLDDAVTITDPTWACVADVIAGMPPTYTWTMLEDQ